MNFNVGEKGEETARKYLKKYHYRIITTNFRKPWGEIDIVAKDPITKEIVFVEVKSRTDSTLDIIYPEEELTPKKIKRLKRAFLSYLSKLKKDIPWRFDLITVIFNESSFRLFNIHHYKNIFLQF